MENEDIKDVQAPTDTGSGNVWEDVAAQASAPGATATAGGEKPEQVAILPVLIIGGAAAAWLLLNPSRAS